MVPSWTDYANVCNDLFKASVNTKLGSELIEQSGVLSYWIMMALKIAESNTEVPLNDRIISLIFMTEIWIQKPAFVGAKL